MSNREFAKSLIDQIPDAKLIYIIAYLQGAALPDESLNADTLEAIAEVDNMIQTGVGEHFSGSTADFFATFTEE